MPYVCSWENSIQHAFIRYLLWTNTTLGKISIGLRDLQNRIRHNLVAEGDVCNRSLLQRLQAVRSPGIPRSSHCKRHLVFFGATVKGILWPGVSSLQILTSLPKSEMKGIHLTLERVPCDDNSQCQGLLRDKIREQKNIRKKQICYSLTWFSYLRSFTFKKNISLFRRFLKNSEFLDGKSISWKVLSYLENDFLSPMAKEPLF